MKAEDPDNSLVREDQRTIKEDQTVREGSPPEGGARQIVGLDQMDTLMTQVTERMWQVQRGNADNSTGQARRMEGANASTQTEEA